MCVKKKNLAKKCDRKKILAKCFTYEKKSCAKKLPYPPPPQIFNGPSLNEAFYVRLNELNPWVSKRNGIKFYAWQLFYSNSSNLHLCGVSARKIRCITQNSFYLFTCQIIETIIKRLDLRRVPLLFQYKALFTCAYHALSVEGRQAVVVRH